MKDLLTIIIPVYNRYDKAIKLYNYFVDNIPNIPILILDNSISINRTIVNKFTFPGTIYKYYDKNTTYSKKLSDGINKFVNTKYSVICAQDDFLSIMALRDCIDFLNKNKDYSGCRGFSIGYVHDTTLTEEIRYLDFYEEMADICQNTPMERVIYHFNNYTSTFYSVHRSEVLKKIWLESSLNTDDLRFGELLPSLLSIVYGKFKMLNLIFNIREYNLCSDGHISETIIDFIRENTFFTKYNNFSKVLSRELSREQQNLSQEISEKIIKKGFKAYLKKNYNVNYIFYTRIKEKTKNALKYSRLKQNIPYPTLKLTFQNVQYNELNNIRRFL